MKKYYFEYLLTLCLVWFGLGLVFFFLMLIRFRILFLSEAVKYCNNGKIASGIVFSPSG